MTVVLQPGSDISMQRTGIRSNPPSRIAFVDYDGDATNIASDRWFAWDIDLGQYDACGVDLNEVTDIYILLGTLGAGSPGGSGTLFIDEIALYPARCISGNAFTVDRIPDVTGEGECEFDFNDIDAIQNDWLDSNSVITAVATRSEAFVPKAATKRRDNSAQNPTVPKAAG